MASSTRMLGIYKTNTVVVVGGRACGRVGGEETGDRIRVGQVVCIKPDRPQDRKRIYER